MGKRPVGIEERGWVPGWALDGGGYGGPGYGDGGYGGGYGGGDGGGYGDGYGGPGYGGGNGTGDGTGTGTGYGDGTGDGTGTGYGDGADVERAVPASVHVTARMLKLRDACGDAVAQFRRVFPTGAEFPTDVPRAAEAGLDLAWARQHLGLLMPKTDECPAPPHREPDR